MHFGAFKAENFAGKLKFLQGAVKFSGGGAN